MDNIFCIVMCCAGSVKLRKLRMLLLTTTCPIVCGLSVNDGQSYSSCRINLECQLTCCNHHSLFLWCHVDCFLTQNSEQRIFQAAPLGLFKLAVTVLEYLNGHATLTAVGRSQLLAKWPGTLTQIISGILRAAQTVLGTYLKCTCSRDTSASRAIGVLNDYALYKSMHSHSLTLMLHCRVYRGSSYTPVPGPCL